MAIVEQTDKVARPEGKSQGSEPAQFHESRNSKVDVPNFASKALELFPKLDIAPADGKLSVSELGSAVENKKIAGEDARAVGALHLNREKISGLVSGDAKDGITKADLQKFGTIASETKEKLLSSVNSDGTFVPGVTEAKLKSVLLKAGDGAVLRIGDSLARSEQFVSPPERRLFGKSGGMESIKPEAVNQGFIGDCYFNAALASVAQTSPEKIRDAIKDNRDGTYSVKFPGETKSIKVNAPTDAEFGIYNGVNEHGAWPLVMEKAYGALRHQQGYGGTNVIEGAEGGGRAVDALKTLTGGDGEILPVSRRHLDEQAARLDAAVNGANPKIALASTADAWMFGGAKTSAGLKRDHVFSITSYEHAPGGAGIVTLRDPEGARGQDELGNYQMTFAEFSKNLESITYEK